MTLFTEFRSGPKRHGQMVRFEGDVAIGRRVTEAMLGWTRKWKAKSGDLVVVHSGSGAARLRCGAYRATPCQSAPLQEDRSGSHGARRGRFAERLHGARSASRDARRAGRRAKR